MFEKALRKYMEKYYPMLTVTWEDLVAEYNYNRGTLTLPVVSANQLEFTIVIDLDNVFNGYAEVPY